MQIYLLRHPPVAVKTGICYGQSDIELAADWISVLSRAQKHLSTEFDSVFCSPLRRCMLPAQQFGSSYQIDERLLELNFGRWEGLPWDDIPSAEFRYWSEDYVGRAPPDGESYAALQQRVASFLSDCQRADPSTVLMVTHAGVIRAALATLLDIPLVSSLRLGLDFAGVSKITLADDWIKADYINRI